MPNEPHAPAPGATYETRDASVRALLYFALGLFAVLVLVLLGTRWMFVYFGKIYPPGPPATPFENVRTLPPGPRLQPDPRQDLLRYRASQDALLNSYGWVDRQEGVIRIPINHAMDLLLQRGLPVRPAAAPVIHSARAQPPRKPELALERGGGK